MSTGSESTETLSWFLQVPEATAFEANAKDSSSRGQDQKISRPTPRTALLAAKTRRSQDQRQGQLF